MKKLRNKYLQKVGDFIAKQVVNCEKHNVILWFNIGLWFDKVCIKYFNLYLE